MPLLHPTPGSVLNQFRSRRPDLYPSLAFPFYHQIGGKTATFVSDGETIMLWTKRRLPGYRDWQIHSGPHGFEPLDWRNFYRSGASFPAPPVPKRPRDAVRTVIFGNIAWLPGWLLEPLATLDTCWLGSSTVKPPVDRGPMPVVSVAWSLGSIVGHGVIICAEAPPLSRNVADT